MDISGQIGSPLPNAGQQRIKSDVPLTAPGKTSGTGVKTSEAKSETVPIPADVQEAANARTDVLKRAAETVANFYPVGENAIAIYRNSSSGEMIYRIRSLKTGEVKEIPEQKIIDFVRQTKGDDSMGVGLSA